LPAGVAAGLLELSDPAACRLEEPPRADSLQAHLKHTIGGPTPQRVIGPPEFRRGHSQVDELVEVDRALDSL